MTTDADIRFSLLELDDAPRIAAPPPPPRPPAKIAAGWFTCRNERCLARGRQVAVSPARLRNGGGRVACIGCGHWLARETVVASETASVPVAEVASVVVVAQAPEPKPITETAPEPATVGAALQTIAAESQQTALPRRQRASAPALTPTSAAEPAPLLRLGEMVAGAAAAGHGVLLSWDGAGPVPVSRLNVLAEAHEIEARVQAHGTATLLNRAVRVVRTAGLVIAHRRAREPVPEQWTIVRAEEEGDVGDAYGSRELIVELDDAGAFAMRGDPELERLVWSEYERLIAAQELTAVEVTRWLRGLLREMKAVPLGPNWYLPRDHAVRAEALCTALAATWGRNWLLPAIPVATCDQLLAGLTTGLRAELAEIAADVATATETALAAGRAEVGARKAAGFCVRLDDLADRVRYYAVALGWARVADIRDAASELLDRLRNAADDASQRSALIWEDLVRFDGAVGGETVGDGAVGGAQ